MAAIREVAHLEVGIPVGPAVYFEAILRPATLADTYRATEAVPVPDDLTSAPARIAYQVQVDDALVLCQIEALGPLEGAEVPGPAALAQVVDPWPAWPRTHSHARPRRAGPGGRPRRHGRAPRGRRRR